MRIAQIAPLAESVLPKLYGGTERVVAWLIDELVNLGHDVTLFASGNSRTRGKLHPAWPRSLRLGRPRSGPAAATTALLEAMAGHANEFDVIHAHIDWLHLRELDRRRVREHFEERFTARRMTQEYTLYYRDLLARSAPRNRARLTELT
jgi:hypothetical protein